MSIDDILCCPILSTEFDRRCRAVVSDATWLDFRWTILAVDLAHDRYQSCVAHLAELLVEVVCHCGSSSVVRLCHPQENGLEWLPADGKAGLRMKEGDCGIGVSFMDRHYWVAGEAAPRIFFLE